MTKLAYDLMTVFWPMFFAVGAALVVLSIWSQPRWTNGQALIKRDWGIVTTLLVGLPLLIVSLTGAAFAYHDDDVLLTTTVAGKPLPLGIWPWAGRYFPLHQREFVVLSWVSSSPIFYYAFIALQLVIICALLNAALAELSVGWRTLACVVALSSSGAVIIFVEAVYPERNVVFLLLIFIVAVQRFDRAPSRAQHGRCPSLRADRDVLQGAGLPSDRHLCADSTRHGHTGQRRTLAIDSAPTARARPARGEPGVRDPTRDSRRRFRQHLRAERDHRSAVDPRPVPSHRPSPRRTSDLSPVPRRQVASRTPDRFTVGSAGRRRCRVLPGTRGEWPRGGQIHGAGRCHRSDVRHP